MEMEMLAAILSMVLVFSLFPLFLWRRYRISRSTEEHEERQIDQVPDINVPGRQPGTRRMRRRHVGSSSSTAVESEEIQEEDAEPGSDYYVAKASKKKEMKKQEREARRQAEEGAREMRQTKQDRYDEIRRRKDEEREAEELKKEEEALARKAKEEEAANAEFEKWKDAFTVEKEGTEEENQDGGQGMLSDFVEYIKMQKCVPLEDLAGEFKLRTQDCINRISALEKMGRLTGVMDDRGKYIYISLEEMKAVADYIKRQGRVSISHLASKSNEFIKLEPIIDATTSTCSSDYIVLNNEHDVILVS